MNNPRISEDELHAYLDEEIPAEKRAEFEARIAAHPEDAARVAAYSRINAALKARYDGVLDEPLPERLKAIPQRRRRPILRYAAGIAWFALGAAAGWQLHGFNNRDDRSAAPAWARRAVVAHVVYSPEVRHPVEVRAEEEDHLVTWLSKRLGTQLRIPHLGALGYTLVGGRLLPGDQGPAAQFMYEESHGQRLTLYVRRNADQTKETAFRFAQDGNVRVFYWIDRGLGLALSGEVSKDELLRVSNAVYQQLNP